MSRDHFLSSTRWRKLKEGKAFVFDGQVAKNSNSIRHQLLVQRAKQDFLWPIARKPRAWEPRQIYSRLPCQFNASEITVFSAFSLLVHKRIGSLERGKAPSGHHLSLFLQKPWPWAWHCPSLQLSAYSFPLPVEGTITPPLHPYVPYSFQASHVWTPWPSYEQITWHPLLRGARSYLVGISQSLDALAKQPPGSLLHLLPSLLAGRRLITRILWS